MRPRIVRLPFLCASLLPIAIGCGGEAAPIRIGLVGPFSQPRGESMQLATELAVSEINGRGGVRGRRIELVIRDDSGQAQPAIRAAQELYDTPRLVAVIGHLTSGATLAAAPVYNGGARPVAAITPSASSPLISGAGDYTFRACPDDLLHGRQLAVWARNQLGARTAAVLYHNDDYGRGVRRSFAANFRALSGRITTQDPYSPDIPSFEPYLRRIQVRGGVDALMIAGTRTAAERILPAVDSVGLRTVILGGDALSGLESASQLQTDGVYISRSYLADQPGERNAQFVTAYRNAYRNRVPDHRGATAYDIVHLLARAIDAAGTNRRAIRDYLAGVGTRSPQFDGVTGTISFDENGEVPNKQVVIGVVRVDRLVTAPGQ